MYCGEIRGQFSEGGFVPVDLGNWTQAPLSVEPPEQLTEASLCSYSYICFLKIKGLFGLSLPFVCWSSCTGGGALASSKRTSKKSCLGLSFTWLFMSKWWSIPGRMAALASHLTGRSWTLTPVKAFSSCGSLLLENQTAEASWIYPPHFGFFFTGIWVKLSHVRNLVVGEKLKNFALLEICVGTWVVVQVTCLDECPSDYKNHYWDLTGSV